MANHKKDMTVLLREAERLGWTKKETRFGWRLLHPSGATTAIHRTGGSSRISIHNLRADIRRPVKAAAR
jgi:hypothetical protein